jgi:hypothetical protein
MNTKQLTDLVESQAAAIAALEARIAELEAARIGMRSWAESVRTRLRALEGRPSKAPKSSTPEWKSGYRPVRTTPRPAAPAAAAAEVLPEPPPCEGAPAVPEDCPF